MFSTVLGRRAENPAHQKLFPQSQATNGAPHSSSDQQIPAFSHSSLLDSPPRPSSSSTMLPAGSSGAAPLSVNHAQPPHAQGLLDPSKFSNASDFGSHAANLEYAVLSSMLHGQTPPSEHNSSNTPNSLTADFNRSFFDTPSASDPFSNTGFDKLLAGTPSTSNDGLGTGNAPSGPMVESRKSETPAQHGGFDFLDAHQPRPLSQAAPSQPPPKTPCGAMRPQDVYNRVNKPYPYAQSYHDLIRHLKERCVDPYRR